MKDDQSSSQKSKLIPYSYVNIPKETLGPLKSHKIDQLSLWAALLAHPYLDIPKESAIPKQHEINAIYSFLQGNKVILRTLNYSLHNSPYTLEKSIYVEKLVEKNESFAETYEFFSVLKKELLKIMRILTENGVEIVFIKSLGQMPLDSNNFDVLVKNQNITKARTILEDLGFTEIEKEREYEWGGSPHKFLYRRLYAGIVMDIHLHTQVAWQGVKFVDEKKLWKTMLTTKIDSVELGFPSPENHLLITIAHAFFENKCLKLSDIIYIIEDFQYEMDWDYIADCTINDNWFEAFYSILRLANHIHESLFERKLVQEDIFEKLVKKGRFAGSSSLEKQLINSYDKKRTLPFKIPNGRIIIAFVKRVFGIPHSSFIGKSRQILSTSRDYVKRRLKREIPGSLVCFSGQDGTGKTMHSKLLQNEFVKRNIDSEYVWSRGIGFSIEPFLRVARPLILSSKLSQSSEYVSKRRNLLKKEPLRTLWSYIMLADEIFFSIFKVRVPLLLGRTVICDRYTLDILVDVKCELCKDINWVIRKIVKRLMPKPKIHFVLDAKPKEIIERKKDLIPELVQCKRYYYLMFSREEKITSINTEASLKKNREEILSLFMKARYLGET